MYLDNLDWFIVILFLAISLSIGLYYRRKAGNSLSDFFLGGRKLPWYIAGLSMVATTFAADTPLWVTEVVAQHGISGNWLWWNMLIGGMLTTFFFAKLWRRSGVLTELEFIELRYSGKAAAFLRGFKAVYLGVFMNVIIIGWVNFALITILKVFFDFGDTSSLAWYENPLYWVVAGSMVFVAFYSSLAGLMGVVATDTVQFFIAMGSCILLAYFALDTPQVGGIAGLKAQLPEWRFDFFPTVGSAGEGAKVLSISIGAFLTFFAVQWWASWYPGAEPGGGGYVAQRMMSAKDENNAIYATLFFQIAHYCLRPWPWIIVALCALILYPNLPLEDSSQGFVLIMRDYLPNGLKGLLLVAFLSAYMSTISTQLNWGASFLTNDLYKRFFRKAKSDSDKEEKHLVFAGRLFTMGIMVLAFFVTLQINTIDAAAKFLIQCGAGLGLVLILRWYWWRVSAWSELAASIIPIGAYYLANYVFLWEFPEGFLFTVTLSTIGWIAVTYLTPPTKSAQLDRFVEKVKPSGVWRSTDKVGKIKGSLFVSWISGIAMTYATLFGMGYVIFGQWTNATIWLGVAIVSLVLLRVSMKNRLPEDAADQ